jgi:hypothetical protein
MTELRGSYDFKCNNSLGNNFTHVPRKSRKFLGSGYSFYAHFCAILADLCLCLYAIFRVRPMKKIITDKYRSITAKLNWIDAQILVSYEFKTTAHLERIDSLLDRRLVYMRARDEHFNNLNFPK